MKKTVLGKEITVYEVEGIKEKFMRKLKGLPLRLVVIDIDNKGIMLTSLNCFPLLKQHNWINKDGRATVEFTVGIANFAEQMIYSLIAPEQPIGDLGFVIDDGVKDRRFYIFKKGAKVT